MTTARTPAGGVRGLRAADGREWIAREIDLGNESEPSRQLVFSCGVVVRHIRNFPPDWFSWSDDDLLDLANPALPWPAADL
jgi:hypothetical protein